MYELVPSPLALIYSGSVINQTSVAEAKWLFGRRKFILAVLVLFWVLGRCHEVTAQSSIA